MTHNDNSGVQASESFKRLYDIVRMLRSPEGCPWDREQTLESLRDALLEESYECVEAINAEDTPNIREELGDVFLLATMMSYIQEEARTHTVSEVLDEVSKKLIRRHPHVFADSTAGNSAEVIEQWNAIKKDEKGKPHTASSLLDGIPGSFPPLRTAWEYQKKAAKVGFDWPEQDLIFEKLEEEIDELTEAIEGSRYATNPEAAAICRRQTEEEIGDLLFTIVNIARSLDIEPDIALHRTNTKFRARFNEVERGMKDRDIPMNAENLELMDELWTESKKRSKS